MAETSFLCDHFGGPLGRAVLVSALMASTALVALAPPSVYAQALVINGQDEAVNGNDDLGTILTGQTFDDVTVGADLANSILTISGGGSLASARHITLGVAEGSEGVVTVSGAGSKLTAGPELDSTITVGMTGRGELKINDGGAVSARDLILSRLPGSSGSVTVAGAGSTLAIRGTLLVSRVGEGTLDIANGGAVSAGHVLVDDSQSARGTVTVSGTGSTLAAGRLLGVGWSGIGVLEILGGGMVSATDVLVGEHPGSSGTVTVSGADSTLTAAGLLAIGGAGQGELDIDDSGAVSAYDLLVGRYGGSSGTVTVSGTGSTLSASAGMSIGHKGEGQLDIGAGGKVSSDYLVVGYSAGAIGLVTVSGAGSELAADGDIIIGSYGEGQWAIADGGTVSADDLFVGQFTGSNGIVTVSGASSTLTAGDLISVGRQGHGELAILDGATVSAADLFVGELTGSSGTVTVSGGHLTLTENGKISVGHNGQGRLDIAAGGKVSSEDLVIGYLVGSSGVVTVSGAGSEMAVASDFAVGGANHGELAIDAGGAVSANELLLGQIAGSSGSVTVSGADSTLTVTEVSFVGALGDGNMNIFDGGAVETRIAVLGFGSEAINEGSVANGVITVSGAGSTLTATGGSVVGAYGEGHLNILDGGAVHSGIVVAGYGSEAIGVITVSGSVLTAAESFTVGKEGTGTLIIGSGGLVQVGGDVIVARYDGSIGTINIGAHETEVATTAGRLQSTAGGAAHIAFGDLEGAVPSVGSGAIVFNHTETDYDFDAKVRGQGTLKQLAGVTSLTGDFADFSGTAEVSGGTLLVNTAFGQAVNVQAGGALGGVGTVGSTSVANGATLAAGNSIGSLNISGDLVLQAGSTLQVEVNDQGQADLIVAGTATINGGRVHVLAENRTDSGLTFGTLTDYTILSAADGISGTFDGLTEDFAFLDGLLTYSDSMVQMTLMRNDIVFASVGHTPNQIATAGGIDSLAGSELVATFLRLDEARARAGFDALSGEVHATAKSGLLADSHFVRDAANDQMRSGPETGLGLWSQGSGGWTNRDSDGNAAAMNQHASGLVVGADQMEGDWRLGLLVSHSHAALAIDDRSSSGTADSYIMGAYGSRSWEDLNVRGGLAYGWHDISTDRSVLVGSFSDSLSAGYDTSSLQFFGELGYSIDTDLATVEPFVGLANVSLLSDGFAEYGGAGALHGGPEGSNVTHATLGLRIERDITLGDVEGKVHGMVGWQHALGDTTPTSSHAFVGSDNFTIAGAPLDRDLVVIEGGVDLKFNGSNTLGLSYSGQLGNAGMQHAVMGTLRLSF